MHLSTKHMIHRAEKTAKRLRDAGQNDRANRFCGESVETEADGQASLNEAEALIEILQGELAAADEE